MRSRWSVDVLRGVKEMGCCHWRARRKEMIQKVLTFIIYHYHHRFYWFNSEDPILLTRYKSSLFILGLLNNIIYVLINSAAIDLVPPNTHTPKGIILFCNIFPAFVAKFGWPYVLKGRIRYERRVWGCCVLLLLGVVVSYFFLSYYEGSHMHIINDDLLYSSWPVRPPFQVVW